MNNFKSNCNLIKRNFQQFNWLQWCFYLSINYLTTLHVTSYSLSLVRSRSNNNVMSLSSQWDLGQRIFDSPSTGCCFLAWLWLGTWRWPSQTRYPCLGDVPSSCGGRWRAPSPPPAPSHSQGRLASLSRTETRDSQEAHSAIKPFISFPFFFPPLERHLTNVHHIHLEGVWSGIPECIVGHHRQVVVHPDKSVALVEETRVLSCRLVVWTLVRSL